MSAEEQIRALQARLQKEQAGVEATRAELHALIVDQLNRGMRQRDLVRLTGYTRERLRQLARAAEQSGEAAQGRSNRRGSGGR